MTNPNNAIGTNAAYGTRTSVNAFNDFAQLVNGRGVLSGFAVVPKSGMALEVGGIAGTRDVAVAEDNLGNRTLVDNRLGTPVDVTIGAASVSQNRYDAIVVYVNNPAQADDTTPDAPSACGIIVVQGGSTGVSENQIRTAITADGGTGSIAYYAVLATVLVPAGATTITSGNITQSHIAISASDIADGEITSAMLADSAVSTAKLAGTAVTTAKIADDAVTPAKLSASDFATTEDGWTVNILPSGKKMWSQSGQGTSDSYAAGAGNWGYCQNIAQLPSSVSSIDDVFIIGFISSTNGSGSTKFQLINGTFAGGDDKFGFSVTELYGSGSTSSVANWSITLIEK